MLYVQYRYRFLPLFLRFFYWIFELFRRCGIFFIFFFFYFIIKSISGEINYVEIVVPFSCGILVLLTIIAIVWKIRAKRRKMRLRSTNIINLSQQSAGLSQSNSLGRNSQIPVRYHAVPNQYVDLEKYVDLETSPRQQSQSHTPNHETDINTLQTVNQRPSQFNTTEMNHGNHGAVIQNSSDSLMSSENQGKTLILRDLRSFVFEISSKLRKN